ncbi:Trk system potassium uptake protein TrkA [Desulfosporosinus sp. I2]|uniref:Trk system potassium transporter TrkA n=1 Tax=Desulfosporosinus sp. I2 TaxID=1617025 RepID=UPI0005EF6526|nr:Trk system potassium transporter TrkA [Desulfosporosinus sp. I2]KJR49485.1 Trk system potassium uptake protein TrkA [Desulfosporosinus sp. I2]
MRIVIVGAGKVGFSLAQCLSKEGHEVTVIEHEEERRQIVQNSLDVMTLSGNGASPQFLADFGLLKADLLVAVTDRDEVNMIACMAAKQVGIPRTIARVRSQEYAGKKQAEFNRALGIDLTINPEMVTALEISRILLTPAALDVEDFGDGRVRLLEVRIRADSPYVNVPLKSLKLPDQVLVVGILRQDRMIIPNGTDCLLPQDSVFFVGAQVAIEDFGEQFAEKKTKIQRVMIIGAGRIGRHLAKILDNVGISIKVIEKNRERCSELAKIIDKGLVLCGDGTDIDLLIEEGVGETDAVVCVTADDKLNLLLALLAKDLGTQKTIVRVGRSEYMSLMGKVGVDVILSPRLLTAGVILRQVRQGEVVAVSLLEGAKAEAMEIVISPKSSLIGRKLKDARIPSNMLIGALVRGDELIIPNGYTILQAGDRAVIFTLPSSIKKISKIF